MKIQDTMWELTKKIGDIRLSEEQYKGLRFALINSICEVGKVMEEVK